MSRNWSKSTILYRCVAILVAGAAVIVLAGRDDSSRRISLAEDPAVPSVAVDPDREFVVVLRPGDGSGGTVDANGADTNIWQAALRSGESDAAIDARVQYLSRSVCANSEQPGDDFDQIMSEAALCLAVREVKTAEGAGKDAGYTHAVETWASGPDTCESTLCERFRRGDDGNGDPGTVDREALDRSEPVIVVH